MVYIIFCLNQMIYCLAGTIIYKRVKRVLISLKQ